MVLWALVILVAGTGLSFFVPIYLLGLLLRVTLHTTLVEEIGANGIGACVELVVMCAERKFCGKQSTDEQ